MRLPGSPSSSTRPKPPKRSSARGSRLEARGNGSASSSLQPPASSQLSPRRFFWRLLRVYGHSMSPALNPGELVLIREGAYDVREPRRGEMAAARPAALGGRAFVKRITGLPLERVEAGGQVWALGPEEFFLMGDRTDHSMDSRLFGPVTRRELLGPVWVRVWPWTVFR